MVLHFVIQGTVFYVVVFLLNKKFNSYIDIVNDVVIIKTVILIVSTGVFLGTIQYWHYFLFEATDLRSMTFTPKSHYIICRCPRLSQINVSREYFSRVKTGVTSKQQKPFSFLPLLFICINIETQIRQQISTFKDSQRLKSVPSDNKLFCCRIDFVRSDRIY